MERWKAFESALFSRGSLFRLNLVIRYLDFSGDRGFSSEVVDEKSWFLGHSEVFEDVLLSNGRDFGLGLDIGF